MNEIFLPKPKKIRIENFSLYSNNLHYEYEFKNGLNLIVGGNGIGKTTFINLIIFGFIGLYTSHNEHQRTYKGEAKKYRQFRNKDFFSKRMLKDVDYNDNAKLIFEFEINGVIVKTIRNIYTSCLEKVSFFKDGNEIELQGKIIDDVTFSKEIVKINRNEYLNYNYENLIERLSNLPFDGIIFFINSILLFDERRDTIFDNVDIQNELFSKYFQDKDKNKQRQEFKDKSTYHDSLARQSSEKIKVIHNILKQFDNNDHSRKILEVSNLKMNEEHLKQEFQNNYNLKEKILYELSQLKSENSKLKKELSNIERIEQEEKNRELSVIFDSLHKNYNIFKLQIKDNHKCPMCNKLLKEDIYEKILNSINSEHCFLCESSLSKKPINTNIVSYAKKINTLSKNIENNLSMIIDKESELSNLENATVNIENKLYELKRKINEEEYKAINMNDNLDGFDVMHKQIKELEHIKVRNKKLSLEYKEKLSIVEKEIERNKIENTLKLSKVFNDYAGAFTRLPCSLKYEDPKDNLGKRFIPTINGIDRLYSDELSESQRFFIDHSFRMAILEAFKNNASFYICETPDSSLDISYEDNASKVFLRYLNNNNVLILTSNFNNSNFIENMISLVDNVGFINLLEIGNPSLVQQQNEKLNNLVKKIKGMINE